MLIVAELYGIQTEVEVRPIFEFYWVIVKKITV